MPDGLTCAAVIEVSFSEILGTSNWLEPKQSGWRFESSGPPCTSALHEICPPNTREFARTHRPTFEVSGRAPRTLREAPQTASEQPFFLAETRFASRQRIGLTPP